ncbi:SAM-dependent methyltransferase, partial [Shewanella sp. 0m-11]
MSFYRSPLSISAFDAKFEAQKIAFAPISFQVARCLLKFNLLQFISESGDKGCCVNSLAQQSELSAYAVGVLVDMGLSMGLLYLNEDAYVLDKIGHFLLHDDMAKTNLNFTHDVCYQGLFELEASLKEGKPKGLSSLGDWPTIYPGLSQLPDEIKKSWFEFDHYYSDHAFESLLPLIFQAKPKHIVDVGGNTG